MAGHRIHAAGDADTDRVEVVALQAGGREGLVEGGGDGGGGTSLVADGCGVGRAAPDVAVGVDDEDGDLRAADVDAGDDAGRRSCRSSMHRQAELAGEQQRARAEERHVLARAAVDDPVLARERAQAAPAGLLADRRRTTAHRAPSRCRRS